MKYTQEIIDNNLQRAVKEDKYNDVVFWLMSGADVQKWVNNNIYEAVKNNNILILNLFLAKGIELNLILQTACSLDNYEMFKWSIERGAIFNNNLLELCFENNSLKIIKHYVDSYHDNLDRMMVYLVHHSMYSNKKNEDIKMMSYIFDKEVDLKNTIKIAKLNDRIDLHDEIEKLIINKDLKDIPLKTEKKSMRI